MKSQTIRAIQNAQKRGVGQFHVICDEEFYTAGQWSGEGIYNSTWACLESAKAVARKKDNGQVYNSDLKMIYKAAH